MEPMTPEMPDSTEHVGCCEAQKAGRSESWEPLFSVLGEPGARAMIHLGSAGLFCYKLLWCPAREDAKVKVTHYI